MKYFKYIAILFVCIAVSCTTEDLGETIYKKNQVQFVGRVMSFAERNVGSRAVAKTEPESEVKTMNLIIFGNDNTCVYISETSDEMVFNIDRGVKDENGNVISGDFIDIDQANLSKCHIFTITNFPELATSGLGVGSPASAFMNLKTQVKGIDIPETGIPMLGICDAEVNLQAGGDAITTPYEVRMHALYSKMVFNITVDADQELPKTPFFTLTDVKVNNVVGSVDFKGKITDPVNNKESESGKNNGTNDTYDEEVSEYSCFFDVDNAVAEDGGNSASFYFYLPERYLRANIAADDYSYPFNRPEDMDYRQRFKPELATEDATYVTFTGVYTDHQGHEYKVSYNIYVGNDNYGNFDVVANTQYNNSILIRGLANSDDQVNVGDGENDPISIDHRVDVERVNPIIINFRRETLLDSHFEVRPLRIRKNPEFNGGVSNAKVKVEVIYDEEPTNGKNWIGLERSFGDGNTQSSSTTYLVDSDLASDRKNAAGKRKYFTTDLTTNTLASSVVSGVTVPVTMADQCVWIYVDECTEAKDDVRSATIRVSYSNDGTTWNEENHIDYVINQRMLFPVTFTNGTDAKTDDQVYLIEYHEEYLHNYDADDEYGQTEYEGMKWGLPNTQLSHRYRAMFVKNEGMSWITDFIDDNVVSKASPFYDFYMSRDTEESSATKRDHAGYNFCEEIIATINGLTYNNNPSVINTKTEDNIDVLHLGQDPQSAIEYCYNKNKRNPNTGKVDNVNWFLPAIDQIEEIVMSQYGDNNENYAYSRFTDFQAKEYWSCQPAFLRNVLWIDRSTGGRSGDYMIDNTNFARATSVTYNGLGADNPDNYDKLLSGMTGYYQVMEVNASGLINVQMDGEPIYHNTPYSFSYGHTEGWSWVTENVTAEAPTYQTPGYKSRDAYARVRCVRKAN